MLTWPEKGSNETLGYAWIVPLVGADTVQSFTADVVSGTVVIDTESEDGGTVSLMLSGGEIGETSVISIKAVTAGGEEPEESFALAVIDRSAAMVITPDELREYLRDAPDADSVLARFIRSASEYVEEATGRVLIARTITKTLDGWPTVVSGNDEWWDGVRDGAIGSDAPRWVELPGYPLASITTVTTYDQASAASEWDAAGNYFADTGAMPGRLVLADGAIWPGPLRSAAAVTIEYVAGYASAAMVPAPLSLAVLQLAAHWYENREAANAEDVTKVPVQAGRIISKYRITKL